MKPTFGSLFSGVGGMDLGLERAGWECRFQVEIDEYCRRVLARHWPGVPKYADIRGVRGEELGYVDLLAGGFPCQDISNAGRRAGIEGERSGLWGEFARLIREIRPRFGLVENVGALLVRGMGRVLGDLAELGYDAEWSVLSACAVGAPHTRERVFIVAYANSQSFRVSERGAAFGEARGVPEAAPEWERLRVDAHTVLRHAGHSANARVVGGANGAAGGVERARYRAAGNAVVPQVAEFIGRRIREAMS